MEIAKDVYTLTKDFPVAERFGMMAQMRRSAISIPSNIAEGYARRNEREFKQFLYIALGSLAELQTQCQLSQDLGWLDERVDILKKLEIARRMILRVCHFERFFLKGEKNEK